MKVTIDSSEPLADALRVVGALYNVSLARVDGAPALVSAAAAKVSPRSGATRNGSAPRVAKKSARAASGRRAAGKRGTSAAPSSEIRQWAKANGHEVSSRGTLPAVVKTAYAAAHGG